MIYGIGHLLSFKAKTAVYFRRNAAAIMCAALVDPVSRIELDARLISKQPHLPAALFGIHLCNLAKITSAIAKNITIIVSAEGAYHFVI